VANILSIQSSPNLAGSASRAVSTAFLDRYQTTHPDSRVQLVDLVALPPLHYSTDHLGAFFAPIESHSAASSAALAASNGYIDQLDLADVVVLGTPMHNFGVSSVMKSWLDNICRLGRTFYYTEHGLPEGLLEQKKIVIVVSSGGVYGNGPMAGFDHAAPHLVSVFQFLGMRDISVIRAEGLAMGPDAAARGLAAAVSAAPALAA
jgi:FMN-dependent NADH-azoreductase